jgi:hypothetical protein
MFAFTLSPSSHPPLCFVPLLHLLSFIRPHCSWPHPLLLVPPHSSSPPPHPSFSSFPLLHRLRYLSAHLSSATFIPSPSPTPPSSPPPFTSPFPCFPLLPPHPYTHPCPPLCFTVLSPPSPFISGLFINISFESNISTNMIADTAQQLWVYLDRILIVPILHRYHPYKSHKSLAHIYIPAYTAYTYIS